jgi:hypothetical protein
MKTECARRDRRSVRPLLNVGLWAGVGALLISSGCTRACDSRIHVQLHDVPETSTPNQASRPADPPPCPPGDPPGNKAISTPAGGHKVTLSWSASTSAVPGRDIRYCVYRAAGGPVREKTGGSGASPCLGCQQVTADPIQTTSYRDVQVENGIHYCYVALAIDAGSGRVSSFSNQADAVIPPKKEPPFCNPKSTLSAKHPRAAPR